MNDSQTIYYWKNCEEMAKNLGMTLGVGSCLTAQGTKEKNSFKSFFSCDTVTELAGYLYGVKDAKDKMSKK